MKAQFDKRELRRVLGSFVTGVTVVTTVDDQGRHFGLTANSFSSVSLDPPLVLWSQAKSSPSHSAFSESDRFNINILAEDQIDIANRFAKSGSDKFADLVVDRDSHGIAILRDTCAWLGCRRVSAFPGGDHTIFVGEIEQMRVEDKTPLIFGRGKYLLAGPHDFVSSPSKNVPFHAMRLGARAIASLAEKFDQTFALAVWGSHGPIVMNWEASSSSPKEVLPVGLTLPVTSTATGMAFAAHLPAEVVDPIIRNELGREPGGDWHEQLRTARGFNGAISIDRYSNGTRALSIPVFDALGHAVLALTAVDDCGRFTPDREGELACSTRAVAAQLSHRLGFESSSRTHQ